MKEILTQLMKYEHFNRGEFIEIAKGKNSIPKNTRSFIYQLKRLWLYRKNK